MKKDRAHLVAFIGVMFALMIVVFMLENFVASFIGITPCILSLPLAVALSVYDDWKSSFLGGTLLGICSCLFCLIMPVFIQFANPLISVLPRTMIGVVAYWSSRLIAYFSRKAKGVYVREIMPLSFGAVLGALTNTVLYLLAVYIWTRMDVLSGLMTVAMFIYFPFELVACFMLVPVYVRVMRKFGGRYFGSLVSYSKSPAKEPEASAQIEEKGEVQAKEPSVVEETETVKTDDNLS